MQQLDGQTLSQAFKVAAQIVTYCEKTHREQVIDVQKFVFKVKRMLLSTEGVPRSAYYAELFK